VALRRTPRWLQVSVLDLLIATSVAAVAVCLFRPAQPKETRAPPWVFGAWEGDRAAEHSSELYLFPDGHYHYSWLFRAEGGAGSGWSLSPHKRIREAFVLQLGERQAVIRSEWGSEVMDVLNEDGTIQSRLNEAFRLEGALHDGVPRGAWVTVPDVGCIEYRNGELVDFHFYGERDMDGLNALRSDRGLPALTERDFSDGSAAPSP
jgi:hypothetical protein